MFLSIYSANRPNMAVPASKKDKKYYSDTGRNFLGTLNHAMFTNLYAKGIRAERAYNDQLFTQEDIDTFFVDESNESRNRVPFNFNMVRPLVEQYRGSLIQSEYSVSVQPVTKQVRTRRQAAMAERRIIHSIAEMSREMKAIMKAFNPLGETMAETDSIFDNQYQDQYIGAMNNLLRSIVNVADQGKDPSDDAFRFACWGLLCEFARPAGSHYVWDRIHPSDFICDTTFKRLDLADAAWKGVRMMQTLGSIAEEFNIDRDQLANIDEVIRAYNPSRIAGTAAEMGNMKVPRHSLYWEDQMFSEFGYVNGPWEVPTLVRVGQDEMTNGLKVSLNDLIEPPQTELNKELFKGEKTRKATVQCTRFIDFVPWEYIGQVESKGDDKLRKMADEAGLADVILDYGVYKLQEYNPYDTAFSRSPIKAVAFALADNQIVTPVQAVLDPNRFANRIMSSVEGMINQSGTKFSVHDADVLAIDEDEVDAYKRKGKSLPVHAKGMGVQNVFASFDESPGPAAYNYMQLLASIQDMVRTVTGVHAPLTGEQTKDQLVGVTEILVQRGALMQEPFYFAHNSLTTQKARFNATAGKSFYEQRPDVLMDMVSEDHFLAIIMSRGFEMERFNAKVDRDNPERTRQQAANRWLDLLIQMGLVDKMSYAKLYNNSSIEDISKAIQVYTAELQQAENEAQRQQVAQQMQAGVTALQQQAEAEEMEAMKDATRSEDMMNKEQAKAATAIARDSNSAALERERMLLENQLSEAGGAQPAGV